MLFDVSFHQSSPDHSEHCIGVGIYSFLLDCSYICENTMLTWVRVASNVIELYIDGFT